MAIFLSFPFGILIYYRVQNEYQDELLYSYKVKPFYLQATDNSSISLSDLRSKVTLLAVIPSKCLSPDQLDEALQRSQKWAKEQLGNKSKKPFQLIAMYQDNIDVSLDWLQVHLEGEQVFRREIEPFFENVSSVQELNLVFIDQNAVVKGVFPYSGIEDWKEIEGLWSRLIFNHYLTDYLSKRTFFGPKREQGARYYH